MVKLGALPDRETIDKYKGLVDFYLWRGIPCARKWPYIPPYARSSREIANQALLGYIMHASATLAPAVALHYAVMAERHYLRWQDYLVRGYIGGYNYKGIAWPYGKQERTLPRFYITALDFTWVGDTLTIEWSTDVALNQWVVLLRTPPYYRPRPKYRRGALWYLDHEIHVDSREAWNEMPPRGGTDHYLTLTAPTSTTHPWVIIVGWLLYDDISEISPSEGPPLEIPQP